MTMILNETISTSSPHGKKNNEEHYIYVMRINLTLLY